MCDWRYIGNILHFTSTEGANSHKRSGHHHCTFFKGHDYEFVLGLKCTARDTAVGPNSEFKEVI